MTQTFCRASQKAFFTRGPTAQGEAGVPAHGKFSGFRPVAAVLGSHPRQVRLCPGQRWEEPATEAKGREPHVAAPIWRAHSTCTPPRAGAPDGVLVALTRATSSDLAPFPSRRVQKFVDGGV